MNNPFEMVVVVVAIVMFASIIRGVLGIQHRRRDRGEVPAERDDAETQALRNEVRTLKERIVVLERIATDSSHRLTDEIESLRDPTR